MKVYFETIDIDGKTRIKLIRKFTAWLKLQRFKKDLNFLLHKSTTRITNSPNGQGYHITISCDLYNKPCPFLLTLREKYDDKKRFNKDMKRPKYSQNVLFDKKQVIRFE